MNQPHTRDRLLQEGRRLFAAHGFRGASVRAITLAADANLGAITYHFGSKQALYRAVLESLFSSLAEHVERAAAAARPAPQRLDAIAGALFAFFRLHPDAPRLLMHQLATGDGLPDIALPYFQRNLAAIRAAVEQGVRAGDIRPVDPLLVAFTIMSQSVWFALVGHGIPAFLGEPVDPTAFASRIRHHVADVTARFLALET